MDTPTIEMLMASTISKKRRVASDEADQDDDSLYDTNGNIILDLTGRKDFGSEECSILAKLLKSNGDGSSNNKHLFIGPRGGELLAHVMRRNQTIVNLDLERNGLGAIGACAIFRALENNTTICRLNMSLNDLKAATSKGNEEATQALGVLLKKNSALTVLLLTRSGLGPKGGTNLAAGLSKNSSLLRLDMVGNDIMADGGQAIGEALKTNTTLRDLNLRWNRIGCGGDRGILSLADALRLNVGLQKLDVSVNELYSDGAIAFGKALGGNQSLVDLCLERNEIGVSGAIAIGEAMKSNRTLERLVLSGNPIGDEGAAAIGQSLWEHKTGRSNLKILEMVGCGVGVEAANAIGRVLKHKSLSLSNLRLEKNKIGPEGAAAIATGLGENTSLRHLNLSRNGIQAKGGRALALALRHNTTLSSLDISYNDIEVDISDTDEAESLHIVEAVVNHPTLKDVDISSNALEIVPIDCQLKLAKHYQDRREINIDLLDNPLSSPPLGRRASVEGLRAYLKMLLSESTAVNRIRLMVLGFGGVGKSTFCDAVTQPKDSLPYFHGSLVPLEKWDVGMIASWARRLGTYWAPSIGSLLESHKISGKDLLKLTTIQIIDGSEKYEPSEMLKDLLETNKSTGLIMTPSELNSFARAIGSLMRKGYFSTVGAVKLEGLLELNPSTGNADSRYDENSCDGGNRLRRTCSLVDFAGQMEYLVSHQLLLSSLHTLCVVLQPAPSFGNPQSRHYGSWMYWSRFLRALGDRRRGSLLLAISQQDKLAVPTIAGTNTAIETELDAIRTSIPNISDSPPLSLDYRPECIQKTIEDVRESLSGAADVVARDWWVPASYEKLANLVRRMEDEKKSNKEVPIVSKKELHDQLPSEGLHKMHDDPQLFQRGIEYLEAVGDVMTDSRLDCLLLDPISWFASFLAHFIRDDDIVTSVQLESRFVQRGVVSLKAVVSALQHEYTKPREQVVQIMSLVCRLELCILYEKNHSEGTNNCDETKVDGDKGTEPGNLGNRDKTSGVSYLFPCLLPMVTASGLAQHWPGMQQAQDHQQQLMPLVYRGYRFRSRNGFFPPGLFPGLLARCRLLRSGVLSPERMWKNCAVLVFGNHTKAMLRIDLCEGENAILDVVGVAPTAEELFVGAAKGQASVVIWMTHLVKMFLRRSYPQLETDEFFLSPFAECHALPRVPDSETGDDETELFHPCRSCFNGTEFLAVPKSGKQYKGDHCCEADGCWSQLGVGHKIETMKPKATNEDALFCSVAQKQVRFELRT